MNRERRHDSSNDETVGKMDEIDREIDEGGDGIVSARRSTVIRCSIQEP